MKLQQLIRECAAPWHNVGEELWQGRKYVGKMRNATDAAMVAEALVLFPAIANMMAKLRTEVRDLRATLEVSRGA